MSTPRNELAVQTSEKGSSFPFKQHGFIERNPPRYRWYSDSKPTFWFWYCDDDKFPIYRAAPIEKQETTSYYSKEMLCLVSYNPKMSVKKKRQKKPSSHMHFSTGVLIINTDTKSSGDCWKINIFLIKLGSFQLGHMKCENIICNEHFSTRLLYLIWTDNMWGEFFMLTNWSSNLNVSSLYHFLNIYKRRYCPLGSLPVWHFSIAFPSHRKEVI